MYILLILIFVVLLLILISHPKILSRSDDDSNIFQKLKLFSFSNKKNTDKTEANYAYMNCPRCKKSNYANKDSLVILCNSCGWNLTVPYIDTKCFLVENPKMDRHELFSNLKANEKVLIDEEPEPETYGSRLAIFNRKNQKIGWVPSDIAYDLLPKFVMSDKIFVTIIRINSGSGIQIHITNDIQKMWKHSV